MSRLQHRAKHQHQQHHGLFARFLSFSRCHALFCSHCRSQLHSRRLHRPAVGRRTVPWRSVTSDTALPKTSPCRRPQTLFLFSTSPCLLSFFARPPIRPPSTECKEKPGDGVWLHVPACREGHSAMAAQYCTVLHSAHTRTLAHRPPRPRSISVLHLETAAGTAAGFYPLQNTRSCTLQVRATGAASLHHVDLQPGSARRRSVACSLISWSAAQLTRPLARPALSLCTLLWDASCCENGKPSQSRARWRAGDPPSDTTALSASETSKYGVPAEYVTYPIERETPK